MGKSKDKDKDKGEQFVEGFKKIFSELETLYNGNGGLQDYSELVNRVTELEQELEEAKSKVAELEEAEKSKVAELEKAESRVAELEEEMKALREKGESDVARLEDEMKSLREEKEKEVHELEQKVAWQEERHDRLVMDFAEKYRDWDVDKQRHNDDLEKLAKLQGELDSATAAVSQAEAEKNELREGSEALASELEKHRTAATELKQRLGQKRLELRWTTYKLNECKLVVKQAKDQLGIIPLDTDRM